MAAKSSAHSISLQLIDSDDEDEVRDQLAAAQAGDMERLAELGIDLEEEEEDYGEGEDLDKDMDLEAAEAVCRFLCLPLSLLIDLLFLIGCAGSSSETRSGRRRT